MLTAVRDNPDVNSLYQIIDVPFNHDGWITRLFQASEVIPVEKAVSNKPK